MPQFTIPPEDGRTKSERVADALLKSANEVEEYLLTVHQESFRLLWENRDPTVTPQAVFDRMGTQGVKFMQVAYGLVQYLLTNGVEMRPEQYTPPKVYTADKDGKITLTE